jgi:hypothetical protein
MTRKRREVQEARYYTRRNKRDDLSGCTLFTLCIQSCRRDGKSAMMVAMFTVYQFSTRLQFGSLYMAALVCFVLLAALLCRAPSGHKLKKKQTARQKNKRKGLFLTSTKEQ